MPIGGCACPQLPNCIERLFWLPPPGRRLVPVRLVTGSWPPPTPPQPRLTLLLLPSLPCGNTRTGPAADLLRRMAPFCFRWPTQNSFNPSPHLTPPLCRILSYTCPSDLLRNPPRRPRMPEQLLTDHQVGATDFECQVCGYITHQAIAQVGVSIAQLDQPITGDDQKACFL